MQNACARLIVSLAFQAAALAAPSVRLLAPQDGNSVAGNAVAVGAIATEFDPTLVRFQYRLFDSSDAFADIGQDDFPLHVVPWDTTLLDNSTYELRAVASQSAGPDIISAAIIVTINNNPNAAVEIAENLGTNGILRRSQLIHPSAVSDVIMSDAARFVFPEGILAADQTLVFERRPASLAPGNVPGAAIGPLTVALTAANLFAPFEIIIPYADSNQDGIEDSTQSPEMRLTTWYFDSQVGWRPIPSLVIASANIIALSTSVLLPKQFEIFKVDQPLIEPGSRNPTEANLDGTTTVAPVLQARLATGPDAIEIEAVTVSLNSISGSPPSGMLRTLRIIRDQNNNGAWDVNETVLAESTESLANAAVDSTLTFADAMRVDPISESQLLVVLSIQPEHSPLTAPARRPMSPLTILGIPFLFCAAACVATWSPRLWRPRTVAPALMIAFCLVFGPACGLFGDSDPSVDEPQTPAVPQEPEDPPPPPSTPAPYVFDVVVQTQGISGRNTTTGQPFSGPSDRRIVGASVELTPP